MSVRTAKELIDTVKGRLADDSSDDAISLLEDLEDTLNDYEDRGSEDWRGRYQANDRQWRERYIARFGNKEKQGDQEKPDPGLDNQASENLDNQPKTFDDLFD